MQKNLSEITRTEWVAYRWTELCYQNDERTFLQDGKRTPDEAAQAMEDWDSTAEERGKIENQETK